MGEASGDHAYQIVQCVMYMLNVSLMFECDEKF
jgi:hypothetical protein